MNPLRFAVSLRVSLLWAVVLLSVAMPAWATSPCMTEAGQALQQAWPNHQTFNMVTFGHSVPAGFFRTPEVHAREAYPRRVADALAARYPTAVINVITSAVGGETSRQGRARFVAEALNHRPRVVTIDYGLNDRMLPLQESRGNVRWMIQQAKAVGSCVVLLTPTPDLGGEPPHAQHDAAAQVAMIRALAVAEGVELADAAASFARYQGTPSDLMAQPNHPNGRGHQRIADAVLGVFPPAPKAQR